MNRRGFTIVELIIVMVIIGVLATWAIAVTFSHSQDTGFTIDYATDANIAKVAALVEGTELEVTILIYSATWSMEMVDDVMDFGEEVRDKLLEAGVSANKIVYLFANETGLLGDTTATPKSDGIYLLVD